MVIYVSVQEIKHDTNKTRDNSTDTFKSNMILVVKLVGVRHTGMRERQTISLCILKAREGVKIAILRTQILNLSQSVLCAVFLTWYLTNRSHLSSLTLWPECSYSKTMTHPKSGPLILFNKCLSSCSELVKHRAFLTRSKGLTKRMKTV